MGDFTQVLERAQSGDRQANEELLPLIYDELRQLAAAKLSREGSPQTLQATALVHEAWLRLGGEAQPNWESRAHFFGAAAEAMRRILIDRARSKRRIKNGGEWIRLDIDKVSIAENDSPDTVLAVHDALERLEKKDSLKASVVKLRYFIGLNHQEIASALHISEVTVRRHWIFARAWLYAELKNSLSA